MGERKRESFSPPALGGSSLLVVFAVLALTVFALLSLSTVRADVRLGDAAAQAVTGYYEADVRAQEILALIRAGETLPGDIEVSVSIAHYDGQVVHTYEYACPISDTQELQVSVIVEQDWYEILRWAAVPVGEWEYDDSLYVWDGGGI